ncbi:MAG TPA: Na+/H+ antiporter subunit C [Anaerolineae bacterium]|nr:Na+/H+ antiporter subunit C [Anaerolineae bacterium]
MEILLALTIAVLYGTGLYMMLRRSIVKIIVGLSLLGHATNLFIFTLGGIKRGQPALIMGTEHLDLAHSADPLPQALILTSIVIGFGVQAFAVVLIHRVYKSAGSGDLNDLRFTDL